jgi:hypothetical protein
MAKADSLGQFEQLVLTAILTLRDDAYGVSIHSKAAELAKPKDVSLGAVYVTLDRFFAALRSHCRTRRQGEALLPTGSAR